MNARMLRIGAVVCAVLLAAACSDGTPRIYRPGHYQGAPVVAPQDSPAFGGNRQAWESAIATRVIGQDEYVRMRSK